MGVTVGRVSAGVFALGWFVWPGFGVIDLTVTWNADWPEVLEAGWGLFSAVVVGFAFVALGVRPSRARAAVAQLVIATVSLAVAGVVAKEVGLLWFASGLALQTALVAGFFARSLRGRQSLRAARRLSRPMLSLAVVGVAPWLVYALHMWKLNREGEPGDVSLGVDHYAMQGALALALALLPVVAASCPKVGRLMPTCTGIAAAYLGLVSFARQESPGALATTWAVAAIAWGVALVAAASLLGRGRAGRAVLDLRHRRAS